MGPSTGRGAGRLSSWSGRGSGRRGVTGTDQHLPTTTTRPYKQQHVASLQLEIYTNIKGENERGKTYQQEKKRVHPAWAVFVRKIFVL